MVREVITISWQATVLEACEFFTMQRLLAFPVVDEERRVVLTTLRALVPGRLMPLNHLHLHATGRKRHSAC